MTKLMCLWLLLWPQAHAIGQGGFNLIYDNPLHGSSRYDHIVFDNDTVTVVGTYNDNTVEAAGIIITQYDTMGNLLREKLIVDSTRSSHLITAWYAGTTVSEDKGFLIPLGAFNRNNPVFLKMSRNLEIEIWSEFEHSDQIMVAEQIIELAEGYMIFGWISRSNYKNMNFVIKTDSSGEEQWRKFYGDSRYESSFFIAEVLGDNEIVISSDYRPTTDSSTDPEDEWSRPWVFAIDSLGKVTWEWVGEKRTGTGWGAFDLRKVEDGWLHFSLDRYIEGLDQARFYFPVLIKRDSAFNELWRSSDPSIGTLLPLPYQMQLTEQNEIVLAGERYTEFGGVFAKGGRVAKYDMAGEKLWEVVDTGVWNSDWGSQSYLHGLAIAPTGSIYCAGRTRATGKEYPWIIKVTSDGCIDTLCTTTAVDGVWLEQDHAIAIFPNPATDVINLTSDNAIREADVMLHDLNGRQVFRKVVDLSRDVSVAIPSHLVSGLYVFTITDRRTGNLMESGKLAIVR